MSGLRSNIISQFQRIVRLCANMGVAAMGLVAVFLWCQSSAAQYPQQGNRTAASSSPQFSVPAPIPTNQTTFAIPIEVHQHPERISEFQLLISDDRGQNWAIYQRRQPNESNFLFEGQRDGEYWFAMRTIDRNQQPSPSGAPHPELVVRLDTQKPIVRFDSLVGQAGSIITRWHATDASLIPESMRIQYRSLSGLNGQENQWIPLEVDPGQINEAGELQGQLNWWPEIAANTIEVKLEIFDAANNVEVMSRQLDVPRVARQLSPNTPQGPRTVADRVAQDSQYRNGSARQAWPSETVDDRNQPVANQTAASETNAMESREPFHVPSRQASTQRVVASTQTDSSPNDTLSSSGQLNPPNANPNHSGDRQDSNFRQVPGAESNLVPATPQSSYANRDRPFERSSVASPASASRQIEGPDAFSLPPGEYALITNRRNFRLTYEVDAVRPESVDRVELWMTTDGGNSWENWASDPDRMSPFPVDVPSEGIFGFKIVVHSQEGFSGQEPQAGDLADVWVEVDLTRPAVELIAAPLGTGPDSGNLVIQWRASDRKLSSRPITLSYAENLEGPWQVISTGLENTGSYNWRVESTLPEILFLRVEAKDRAGNLARHDLTSPVDLRRLNPTGRILGFDDSESTQPIINLGNRAPFRRVR